ncbi:MAG: phenylalanine--tRNA ligase subunit alpha, partial [Clostridia bacterium]|nr:phenylalanine--tRNA ligase subunit alpha [Clostridia bacterium]
MKSAAEAAIASASSLDAIEELRVKYLGKKGELTAVMKGMGGLSAEERPVIGQLANVVRDFITNAIEEKKAALLSAASEQKILEETIDVTIPGNKPAKGNKHPLTQVLDDLKDIFIGMGFSIAEGPEVELDYYNFEALNIPKDHPARDTQDTFYIDDNVVLRTQTSPVQVRVMENQEPPIRIIAPGRV